MSDMRQPSALAWRASGRTRSVPCLLLLLLLLWLIDASPPLLFVGVCVTNANGTVLGVCVTERLKKCIEVLREW